MDHGFQDRGKNNLPTQSSGHKAQMPNFQKSRKAYAKIDVHKMFRGTKL